jgi:hypothetical protein
MLYKLFRLREGYKFMWYQNREVYYENYKLANIRYALADVWNDKDYLLKHLET